MPAKKELIGYDIGVLGSFPVERGKIHEFATALLDDNPIYHDPEYASRTSFGGVLAPPTFTMVMAHFLPPPSNVPDLGLDPTRILHGEQEFEYYLPILAGDVLTARTRISDIYEKEGKRGGTLTFVVFETEFTNQRGQKVAVSRMTVIETSRPAV